MKKVFFALIFFVLSNSMHAQQVSPEELSMRIAQRMKDSLGLTETTKGLIYSINMDLSQRKALVWQNGGDELAIQTNIQQIENMRDSLYKPVLGNMIFPVYQLKKRNLVHNKP